MNAVGRFEAEVLRLMRAKHKDLLDTIRNSKQLASDTDAKLKAILDDFAKAFA